MVEVILRNKFKSNFKKIKNSKVKERIKKQIIKIIDNPTLGKPMKFSRKGTRELYIQPFRIAYKFKNNIITFIEIYHKDNQ